MLLRDLNDWEAHKARYRLPDAPGGGDPESFPCFARNLGFPIDEPQGPYRWHYVFFYPEDAWNLLDFADVFPGGREETANRLRSLAAVTRTQAPGTEADETEMVSRSFLGTLATQMEDIAKVLFPATPPER